MAIFHPEEPSIEKETSDTDILSRRSRSGALTETAGDGESSLGLLVHSEDG
jgi:hypothetical protein